MGDITDLFSTVSKTKVTPTKGYNNTFTTTSATFVDVTGLSVSVPNNGFYVVKGILTRGGGVDNGQTISLQILLGATVVYTNSYTSSGSLITIPIDSLILQNTTGSTQTAKVQIKVTGGFLAGVTTMSIVQGININSISAWANVTSIDFVGCDGAGGSLVTYEGIQIADNVTTAVTWSGNKFVSSGISFAQGSYVAWDWAGKWMVT